MCASHKPPRCRERDVPCPLCDKNAECMCDVSVCVLHAGRPSTAKHSLRTRKRNPSRRRMDGHSEAHACMRTCAGMYVARGTLRGRVRVGTACA